MESVSHSRVVVELTPPSLSLTPNQAIAWTWNHFIEANPLGNTTNDVHWILELPMTKAAVRAIDALVEILPKLQDDLQPTQFIAMGGSKRGWTTWLAAAMDERIVAALPIVFDVLNFQKVMHHFWRAYGGWTYALQDFYSLNFTAKLDDPSVSTMMSIIDPYVYAPLLNQIPKFLMTGSGDQFMQIDDTLYFDQEISGEFHWRMMENCGHGLSEDPQGALNAVTSFIGSIVTDTPRPTFNHQVLYPSNETAEILVTIDDPYSMSKFLHADVWYAQTPAQAGIRRDFRLTMCPNGCLNTSYITPTPYLWQSTRLNVSTSDPQQIIITANMSAPLTGYLGFVIDLSFSAPMNSTFRVTAGPAVLPTGFPFPDCSGQDCRGVLL